MSDEALTPLQESAAATGRRFFRAAPAVYNALCAEVDARRGFPAGALAVTTRSFPDPEDAPKAPGGDIMISVETWRFDADDAAMIDNAIAAGLATELTAAEHALLFPSSPALPTP